MLEKINAPGFETLSKADEVVCENVAALLERGLSDPVVAEIGVGVGATTRELAAILDNRGALHLYDFESKLAELIADLEQLVPCIVDFERKVRTVLFEEQRASIEDRVSRSHGMLCTARSIATDVALLHLSNVRLGAILGLLPGVELSALSRIAVQIQKGHVHMLAGDGGGRIAEATERDKQRAAFLRRRFAEFSS
jgi:protein arginine kinase